MGNQGSASSDQPRFIKPFPRQSVFSIAHASFVAYTFSVTLPMLVVHWISLLFLLCQVPTLPSGTALPTLLSLSFALPPLLYAPRSYLHLLVKVFHNSCLDCQSDCAFGVAEPLLHHPSNGFWMSSPEAIMGSRLRFSANGCAGEGVLARDELLRVSKTEWRITIREVSRCLTEASERTCLLA